jgi:hypothetical protein
VTSFSIIAHVQSDSVFQWSFTNKILRIRAPDQHNRAEFCISTITYLQESATGLSLGTAEYSTDIFSVSKIHFKIISSVHLNVRSSHFFSDFSTKMFMYFSSLPCLLRSGSCNNPNNTMKDMSWHGTALRYSTALDLYSISVCFECKPEHRLSCQFIVIFFSPTEKCLDISLMQRLLPSKSLTIYHSLLS